MEKIGVYCKKFCASFDDIDTWLFRCNCTFYLAAKRTVVKQTTTSFTSSSSSHKRTLPLLLLGFHFRFRRHILRFGSNVTKAVYVMFVLRTPLSPRSTKLTNATLGSAHFIHYGTRGAQQRNSRSHSTAHTR